MSSIPRISISVIDHDPPWLQESPPPHPGRPDHLPFLHHPLLLPCHSCLLPLILPPSPAWWRRSSRQDMEAQRFTTDSCLLSSPIIIPFSMAVLVAARPYLRSCLATLLLAIASSSMWPPSDCFIMIYARELSSLLPLRSTHSAGFRYINVFPYRVQYLGRYKIVIFIQCVCSLTVCILPVGSQ